MELFLERCGWQSFAWLNGVELGARDSLVAPHVYRLDGAVRPGTNRLTVMIDNSNRRGGAAGSRADGSEHRDLVLGADRSKRLNCGGHHAVFGGPCWNGITGRMEVRVRARLRIDDLQVYPRAADRIVRVRITVANDREESRPALLVFSIRDLESDALVVRDKVELICDAGRHEVVRELAMPPDSLLWDEFSPHLYEIDAELEGDGGSDTCSAEFGLRDLGRAGTRMTMNDRPIFLRGELENFVHPIIGYPPTETDYWQRIFAVYRDHGLNHIRFHTCCPPEAAFAAADRAGMILNVELPGCSGEEPEDRATLDYLQDEALRILATFGNHPSFCMLTMGNELLYEPGSVERSQPVLTARVARCREADGRHWYCCTAHPHTEGRDDDFYVSAWPRGATWDDDGEPITGIRWSGFDVVESSRFNARPPETASDYRDGIAGIDAPVVTHEVGQWAVYPDVREIDRFDGVFRARNLEIIREFMETQGTLPLADDFVRASGALSLLLYKEEIESAMRTPGLGGFQLLGFHDHPPQGTSTVGIVTALREPKGIVTAGQFRRFCGPTVPLARLAKRTYTSDETLRADVEVAHFGPTDLDEADFSWTLLGESGTEIASGRFASVPVPTGRLTRLGEVRAKLSGVGTATRTTLTVSMDGAASSNSWDVWIYPPAGVSRQSGTAWFRAWSSQLREWLEGGGAAVLELPAETIPGATPGCFTTVFWNPIMKRQQRALTMGVLCDPHHPALARFPTETHTNWQWWDVLRPSRVLDVGDLDPRPEPIVRMIDSFIGNRTLGVLFEARVRGGRLLVTSLDLTTDLPGRHAARQLRLSLEEYVGSPAFDPRVEIGTDEMDELLARHREEPPRPTRDEIKARFDRPRQAVERDGQAVAPCPHEYS